jgi:F0F1-type ATP synthase membrane subunit c/vacuolar-type H+-ATPase subunit K
MRAFRGALPRLWRIACGLLLLICCAPAFGQGCAMCKSTAAALNKDGQRAISKGVLVLLAPPVTIGVLGVAWAFRYGKKRDEENLTADSNE